LLPWKRDERLHRDRKADSRGSAQRDRDRVLYSSALRRLGHVTQVVSPDEGIVFHNRLTHSLEVAQIGRRIAERLNEDESERQRAKRLGGVDPHVVETAALVHDLGHPPHGHAVETELDRVISGPRESGGYEILDGYEDNAQSFRIVTKLAMRNLEFGDLNLTRASLNASLKYPWFRKRKEEDAYRHKKRGAYRTEEAEFDWVREGYFRHGGERCAEAALMDWADDVAYAVHDVDDFYRAGIIPLDRLRNPDDQELEAFCQYAAGRLRNEPDQVRETLLDVLDASPIVEPFDGTQRRRKYLRAFTANLIAFFAAAVELADDLDDPEPVKTGDEARARVDVLKELTWRYVIDSRAIKTQQHGQRRVVRELFDAYYGATGSEDDDLRGILPADASAKLGEAAEEVQRVRVVADLISSMTERQLALTHLRLTGVEPGSITDLL
jgi:dGTPase